MSLALYRKYRSATFADLIGQEHIAATLRNQVCAGDVSHAYLFTGIRGTGKTSSARILARAVNCLDPQQGEPCNRCAACVEITRGGAVDVLEIDAASNRGIDEMRDLREKVKFSPAVLRRKVYIVDEAHMLTEPAWNAFLKTLEEPPDHVIFMLATTDPNKVPDTVRSRVQRFDFRRVGTDELAAHLGRVVAWEGATADDDALLLVAQAGQGSVRDALSVLDQALTAGEGPLTVVTVRRALGLSDPVTLGAVLGGIAAGDPATTLRGVAAAFDAGADPRQLLREMARLARGAELTALGYAEGAQLSATEVSLCAELAAAGRPGIWVDAIDRFAEAEINLRQPVDGRLQVELALLRLTHRPPEDVEHRLARLEAAAGVPGSDRVPRTGVTALQAAAPGGLPPAAGAQSMVVTPSSPVTRLPVPPAPSRPAGAGGGGTGSNPAASGGSAAIPAGGGPPPQPAGPLDPAGPAAVPASSARGASTGPSPMDESTGVSPMGTSTGPSPTGASTGPSPAVASTGPSPTTAGPATPPAGATGSVAPDIPPPVPAPIPTPGPTAPADLAGWIRVWPQVIEVVNRRDPMLAGVLRSCRPLDGAAGRLVVGAPYGFHLDKLEDPQKAPLLAAAVAEIAGAHCAVEAVFSGEVAGGGGDEAAATPAGEAQPDTTSLVLATFPGSTMTGSVLRDSRHEAQ